MDTLWELTGKVLGHGTEGRKAAFILQQVLGAVDEGIAVFNQARDIAASQPGNGKGNGAGLSRLEQITRRAHQVRQEVIALRDWLNTPPPAVSPVSIATAGDSPVAEGYESIDTILARLSEGGDV